MELFNIGFGELFFIILIALVVLGPEQMIKIAHGLGKLIRSVVRSPIWTEILSTSRQIREFPEKIMREADLEESLDEIKHTTDEIQMEIQKVNQESLKVSSEIQSEIRTIDQEGQKIFAELQTEMKVIDLENQEISNHIQEHEMKENAGSDISARLPDQQPADSVPDVPPEHLSN